MRRQNWIFAVILCAGMLLALAQTVRAEPDPALEDPAASESTTTTKSRSTYDWEAETDRNGVTVYPPPPDDDFVHDDGPTTTTAKTSRTSAPFQYNPDHPEDNYTGALPQGNLPNFNAVATDIYGNEITRVITAPPTTETTTEEPTTTEEITEETIPEEPDIPARTFNWTVAAIAGGALAAAVAGGIAVVAKGKKDSDDDYIYEEPEESAQAPEE